MRSIPKGHSPGPATRSPDLERIFVDPTQSFHWNEHDFPSDLARWNYHPEYEIHLTRVSHGIAFVGDYIGRFRPGNLVLVGPNLPHHWESDRRPDEVFRLRDVALQFDSHSIERATQLFPELAELGELLTASRRGLEFRGAAAKTATSLLERIGHSTGLQRLILFLELLRGLARTTERRPLASVGYLPSLEPGASRVVQRTMAYILDNLTGHVKMSEAARLAGMTEPTFCRFFKRNAGNNFVDYLRKLRIGRACKLLAESSLSVTDVCFEVGYHNISNFNHHFRREKGVTPTQYRRLSAHKTYVGEEGSEGAVHLT